MKPLSLTAALARGVAGAAAWLALGLAAAQAQSVGERFQAVCQACHGPGGVSATAGTPSLAGQPSFYAITQLFLFREGRRANAAMTAVAKTMSDDDLRAFSDHIGTLPPPAAPGMSGLDPQRMERGARLAQEHRCGSCHGADYSGGKQVARLAQQREDYLAQTLQDFQSGKRLGYTTAMNETLVGISAQGLLDLAYFLAHVPKSAP